MKRTDFIIIHSIVACFILLAISPKLSSQEISWELSNGPKNSQGTFLPIYALGSTQNGYVFAGTNGLGVFKSTDMGENWENCSSPLFDYATISYLVVDTEDNVFVATNVGLYKTSDYGQNWIELLTGSSINSFQSLAVGENGLTFAGQQGGIYRSLDYGNNWMFVGLDSCIVWVIKTHNDSIVVAGTVYDGPFISMDKGDSWESINNGLDHNHIVGMSISKSGDLFVGVYDGIFRSSNWGENWERVLLTSASLWIGVLYIHMDKFIFAGSRGEGIYLSSDNGNIWSTVNSGIENLFINSFCGNSEGFVFVGSDSGVYKSSEPVTSVKNNKAPIIFTYLLNQNYPNPFNPTTKIRYQIPDESFVIIKVYDILGNEVANLVNEKKESGVYEVELNSSGLSSGTYIYRIVAGNFTATKKMLLMK